MKRLTLIIHGSVQGIFFRTFVKERARKLALTGTVRNEPKGSVEVIAEGEESALRVFLRAVSKGYPPARVAKIEERWAEGTGAFSDFNILYD
ncbi:MAG: hypothetical protein A2849_02015 [Candidatus Taylorbacteria bacterium RIFCSPHIGHO2_01_FULL_51_15]|uniref:acylphosphatase n=1 Tax=Candidatus Taylorbacteria bacterium RIFCSPHIGHO2_01_FULL_51_15 TaxID=1802304 RepID=A0A1G2MAF1_9BACT|nr:MAG: hypothetical protein A2849_02015 [Candidatus Taylorbacteria bacterium RIFCSPHIGHO2_01_FULL_51_15]